MSNNSHWTPFLEFLMENPSAEINPELSREFGLTYEECQSLGKISKAIEENKYSDAVEELKAFQLEQRPEIRNFFSAKVLIERSKEWTGHGINRTFRFWSEAQKKDYLSFTMKTLNALCEKYDACLGYGSVLSIVRDHDLIPHDDDLDIIVSVRRDSVSSYKAALEQMEKHLVDSGFSVRGDYLAHRHVANDNFMLDVFLGMEDGDFVSWHPGPRDVMRKDDVFPAKAETMFGIDCLVPKDCETYLSAIYGENWRTPLPGWTHDFDPKKYADWFWPKPG